MYGGHSEFSPNDMNAARHLGQTSDDLVKRFLIWAAREVDLQDADFENSEIVSEEKILVASDNHSLSADEIRTFDIVQASSNEVDSVIAATNFPR